MHEGEPRRVQELALQAQVAFNPVDRVARDRQVDRREVDADLMRAARLQANPQQRVLGQQLLQLEVRHRVARRVGVERTT